MSRFLRENRPTPRVYPPPNGTRLARDAAVPGDRGGVSPARGARIRADHGRERRARESRRQNDRVLRRADGCARGASERPHLPRGGRRLGHAPGHARPQRGLRAALVARRLDPVLPLGSQGGRHRRSSSRSSPERSARRGSSPRSRASSSTTNGRPTARASCCSSRATGPSRPTRSARARSATGRAAVVDPARRLDRGRGRAAPCALHPGGRERRAPAGLARSRQRLGGGLVRGREHRRHRLRGRRRGRLVPRRARADRPRRCAPPARCATRTSSSAGSPPRPTAPARRWWRRSAAIA